MPPIHGSCLCGGVEFEIDGPLTAPLNCHCSLCRKQHGAAFRSRMRGEKVANEASGMRAFRHAQNCHCASSPDLPELFPGRLVFRFGI